MDFAPSSIVTFWSFLLVDLMEAMDIPEIFKELWKKWDIRIFILVSLFIQIILIFLGRLRKISASIIIRGCLWCCYVLADMVAAFTLGRLSYKMDDSSSSSNAIKAFWAPFLILHLGGPDTITAYAMEDNELWLRHLFALCYELGVAFYVLFLSLPNTVLLAPTLLIFFVGIIKYVERTYSLYKASTENFRRSIGFASNVVEKIFPSTNLEGEASTNSEGASTNSEGEASSNSEEASTNLEREASTNLEEGASTNLEREASTNLEEGASTNLERKASTNLERKDFLKKCFKLYTAFKPCFADIHMHMTKVTEANKFLKNLNPKEVLEVMDRELSYAYDEFYTKAIVNHSRAGYVLRALCSICIWLAFILYVLEPKVTFDKVDIAITYFLLAASIFLDATTIAMLLFSDWTVVSLLNVKKQGYWTEELATLIVKIKSRWLKRRFRLSEMPQLNLISNCLNHSEKNETPWQRMKYWIKKKLGLVQEAKLFPSSYGDITIYTLHMLQPIKTTQVLQLIIVEYAQSCLTFCSESPLLHALLYRTLHHDENIFRWIEYFEKFAKQIRGLPLDKRVVVWHIATELCFHWNSGYHPQLEIETEYYKPRKVEGETTDKDVCKYLSNYMMHMLVMRPEVMSTMGGNTSTMLWDEYNSMYKYIHKWYSDDQSIQNANVKDVCTKMWNEQPFLTKRNWSDKQPFNTEMLEAALILIDEMHSDHGSSFTRGILETASILAYRMLSFREEHRWQVMTKEWVQLLINAGDASKANLHLKQLSKEVEPLTYIWLLNRHMDIVL